MLVIKHETWYTHHWWRFPYDFWEGIHSAPLNSPGFIGLKELQIKTAISQWRHHEEDFIDKFVGNVPIFKNLSEFSADCCRFVGFQYIFVISVGPQDLNLIYIPQLSDPWSTEMFLVCFDLDRFFEWRIC